jgi:hypothetical protein
MSQAAITAYEAAVSRDVLDDHGHWDIIEAEWKLIKAKYPLIFKGRDLGTLVGPGWWPILEEAFIGITGLLELCPGSSCQAQQIKEKFGGLRFYTQSKAGKAPDEEAFYSAIGNYIRTAEIKASHTCEACGAPGECGGKNWLKTYCEKHAAQQAKRDKRG